MELQQLGKEYIAQSVRMYAKAQEVSAKRKNARGLELFELQKEAIRLEDIARDLRITGEYLIHYYEKDNENPTPLKERVYA